MLNISQLMEEMDERIEAAKTAIEEKKEFREKFNETEITYHVLSGQIDMLAFYVADIQELHSKLIHVISLD